MNEQNEAIAAPAFNGATVRIVVRGGVAAAESVEGGPVRVIIHDYDNEEAHDEEERGPYEPEVEDFNVGGRPSPGLLARLLEVIDDELDQRQSSGIGEEWADLQALSDEGHAALAAPAPQFTIIESGEVVDGYEVRMDVVENGTFLDLEFTSPLGRKATLALEVYDGELRAIMFPTGPDGEACVEPTFVPSTLDSNIAILMGEG